VRRGQVADPHDGLCDADLSDSNAAVAVGRGRTSNSRCRPHCSRSGPSVTTPAMSGIEGTADIAGRASANTRSPAGQSSVSAADWRRSKPNVCCSSTRPVATDPNRKVNVLQSCRTLGPATCGLCVCEAVVHGHLGPARSGTETTFLVVVVSESLLLQAEQIMARTANCARDATAPLVKVTPT
jgi:hypothetical protein